ncbi:hypothetical protein AB0939_19190 [Streptomyces sp. NPDC006990]|uniref:hypothetical protein n=1 Tax=unclassified Streptomyces TaxID=2593676 RepID=UPI003457074C
MPTQSSAFGSKLSGQPIPSIAASDHPARHSIRRITSWRHHALKIKKHKEGPDEAAGPGGRAYNSAHQIEPAVPAHLALEHSATIKREKLSPQCVRSDKRLRLFGLRRWQLLVFVFTGDTASSSEVAEVPEVALHLLSPSATPRQADLKTSAISSARV